MVQRQKEGLASLTAAFLTELNVAVECGQEMNLLEREKNGVPANTLNTVYLYKRSFSVILVRRKMTTRLALFQVRCYTLHRF